MVRAFSGVLKLGTNFITFNTFVRLQSNLTAMSGLPLTKVVDVLHSYADPVWAESWDNVGLLVQPSEEKCIKNILITNDLTEDVTDEAVNSKFDMIISYHPPIFVPLKRCTNQSWKERIIVKCIENKIAVYSPHTSFDSIEGGVNDWLVSAFESDLCVPIIPSKNIPEIGMGRLCSLKSPISINKAVDLVKALTQLTHVKLARARNGTCDSIKIVAVCAGSGQSVLKDVEADLYLTGEMSHHDVLDAIHRGTHVILTNHSNSERGFLKVFANLLASLLNNEVVVKVSEHDTDPLKIV